MTRCSTASLLATTLDESSGDESPSMEILAAAAASVA
jgi:hypothetical protein